MRRGKVHSHIIQVHNYTKGIWFGALIIISHNRKLLSFSFFTFLCLPGGGGTVDAKPLVTWWKSKCSVIMPSVHSIRKQSEGLLSEACRNTSTEHYLAWLGNAKQDLNCINGSSVLFLASNLSHPSAVDKCRSCWDCSVLSVEHMEINV